MASTVRIDESKCTPDDDVSGTAEDAIADDTVVDNDVAVDTAAVEERASTRWIGVGGTILVAVVALVSIVVCVVASLSWRSTVDDERRNRDVLDVASTMAVNLVTLGSQTADADLGRVIDGTTGDFREQFVSAADGFGSLLSDGGVESTGEVRSVGIVDASDEQSTVLAAVTSTVKNNEAPDGEVRVYRMKITLDRIDGRWLVSNVEFVA
jgi:Mce-associated membrane protein